jgi:predicted Rossmann fold flavoprotein
MLKAAAAASGKRQVASLMADRLPRRIIDAILAQAKVDPEVQAGQLPKADRARIAQGMKRLVIPVSGTRGYAKAEVTAGGVSLDEVDSRSLESKRVPGLYFAGEVLDLDGPIGGYNFQAAFSTGWLAGASL